MVVFVPYQLIDLPVLALCLRSIRQYALPAPDRITVVGPPLPAKLAAEVERLNVGWMDDSKVIPDLTRETMPGVPCQGRDLAPQYYQRCLAWGLADHSTDDLYAVIHANAALISPLPFLGNKVLLLPADGRIHPPILQSAQKLIGPFTPPSAFSRHSMIFHKQIVAQLLQRIRQPKPWRSFHHSILDSLNLDEPDSFCEFNTYGWYAMLAYGQSVQTRPAPTIVVPKDLLGQHDRLTETGRGRQVAALAYQGGWLDEVDKFLAEAQAFVDLRDVKVMLDVGSRDGEVSLSAKRLLPNARVYAFECNPDALKLCRSNLRSRLDVMLVERAVSDISGPVDFYSIDPVKSETPHMDGNIGASSLFPADPAYPYEKYAQKKITVEATTLADWAASANVSEIDLIWMDLQGAELQALRGLGDLLQKVKIIYTEVEYKQMYVGQPSHHALREFMEAQGFRLHKLMNTSDWFGNELYIRKDIAPRPAVLSAATLGINGRFGNQIFQYAFLRILAKHHGFTVQTPPWVGQYLFGHNDAPAAAELPRIMESRDFPNNSYPEHLFKDGPANRDLWGYFQFDTHHYAPHKDFFRSLFQPVPAIEAPLRAALDRLTGGRTLVALHIRRGDYQPDGIFFTAPTAWYRTLLEKMWPTLHDPILYIASDEPGKVLPDFQDYHPLSAADLGVTMPEAPFYSDFYVLSQANVLAISNSSFSFLPAMLNERAKDFYRPHLHRKELIPFDPWNSPTLLHRDLAQIPQFMQPAAAPSSTAAAPAISGVQIVGKTAAGSPIISFGKRP